MTTSTTTTIIEYLTARLAYEVDVVEVEAGMNANTFVLADTRKQASWDHGHVRGAVHAPASLSTAELSALFSTETPIVVYGWGPGCNGATHAALALTELGYSVREMIGGFEYWCRNGFPIESATDGVQHLPDPLVTAES